MRPRAWVSWSSGKDSAWALHVARESVEVVGLLTTVTAAYDRVSMHGVRRELLQAQAERVALPLHVVEIPSPCPNEAYEARMGEAIARARAEGVEAMVFGDLFLADIRAYRERMLAPTGIAPVFPLWGRDTRALAQDMLAAGVDARITCLDPTKMPRELAGTRWDPAALPSAVDPCGEHGEFHTFVCSGPDFTSPIDLAVGEIVEREGFVFADLLAARWSLRPLGDTDSIEQLTVLIRTAYKRLADDGLAYTGTQQDAARTRERIAKGECWVAELDGVIVATIVVAPRGFQGVPSYYRRRGVAVASQFAVDPRWQGLGIGRALMRKAEERARAFGATELAVDTAEPAEHLVAMYERWGYTRVDTVEWGHTNYRSLILTKPLVR